MSNEIRPCRYCDQPVGRGKGICSPCRQLVNKKETSFGMVVYRDRCRECGEPAWFDELTLLCSDCTRVYPRWAGNSGANKSQDAADMAYGSDYQGYGGWDHVVRLIEDG